MAVIPSFNKKLYDASLRRPSYWILNLLESSKDEYDEGYQVTTGSSKMAELKGNDRD